MRTCKACKETKSLTEYYVKLDGRDGKKYYDSYCRKCSMQRQKEYIQKQSPEYRRNLQLKTLYGITIEEFNKMLEEQGGVCAICKQPETEGKMGKLTMDHDHETGYNRQILCGMCNRGLGHFKDNPELLRAAANYIEEHYL